MTTRPSGTTPTPVSANGWATERISSPPCARGPSPYFNSIPRPQFHLERRPAPGPALPAAQPPLEIDQTGVARPAPRQHLRGDFGLVPAYPAAHPDHMPDAQVFEPEGITGRQAVVHVRGLFLSIRGFGRQEPPAPGLPPSPGSSPGYGGQVAGAGSARRVSRADHRRRRHHGRASCPPADGRRARCPLLLLLMIIIIGMTNGPPQLGVHRDGKSAFPADFHACSGWSFADFRLVIDLQAIFDREQWISTPGCAILNFDSIAQKRVVFA
jgi:hypothetical protein